MQRCFHCARRLPKAINVRFTNVRFDRRDLPIRRAIAYVIELYRELTAENGAPSLGTQNQVIEFHPCRPRAARGSCAMGLSGRPG